MAQRYDVAIIGGGINGAATACYAAARGLAVALFEKKQCGEQTTAGSSRLIHGGLRYLSYNIGTTVASCIDSGLILRMVPHLVERRVFILPIFTHERWMMEFAEAYLELYDHYQPLKGGKMHVRLSAGDVRALVPGIHASVAGGLTFDEWLVDPVRLVREHVAAAQAQGAEIFENTKIREIRRANDVFMLQAASSQHGTWQAEARTLVNAAGPWVDRVAQLMGIRIPLRPTKGVHLVLEGCETRYGIVGKTRFGARMFIMPLGNTTLIGPTDDDVPCNDPNNLCVSPREINVLKEAAEEVLPGLTRRHSVIGTTVALRALPQESGPPRKISRDFQIIPHDREGVPGAISVFSGKMSEYHLMASRVVEYIGRYTRGNAWQEDLYARQLPECTHLAMMPHEKRRILWLLKRFKPRANRLARQLNAWTRLACSFAAHWPKKIAMRRRGLAVFYDTYGAPTVSPPQTTQTSLPDHTL